MLGAGMEFILPPTKAVYLWWEHIGGLCVTIAYQTEGWMGSKQTETG